MVMPRSRSMSMESSTCSLPAISRSVRPPVIWIRRSASVDLPWSIWATMEKLRMFEMGTVVMGRGIASEHFAAKENSGRHAKMLENSCFGSVFDHDDDRYQRYVPWGWFLTAS